MRIAGTVAGLLLMLAGPPVIAASIGDQQSCRVRDGGIDQYHVGGCKGGLAEGRGAAYGLYSYEGEFRAGYPDGHGRYDYQDGSYYEGLFRQGERIGGTTFYPVGIPQSFSAGVMQWAQRRGDVLELKGRWLNNRDFIPCDGEAACLAVPTDRAVPGSAFREPERPRRTREQARAILAESRPLFDAVPPEVLAAARRGYQHGPVDVEPKYLMDAVAFVSVTGYVPGSVRDVTTWRRAPGVTAMRGYITSKDGTEKWMELYWGDEGNVTCVRDQERRGCSETFAALDTSPKVDRGLAAADAACLRNGRTSSTTYEPSSECVSPDYKSGACEAYGQRRVERYQDVLMNICKRPVEYVAHCGMFTTGRRVAEPGAPIPFIGNCTLERFEKTQRR